MRALRKIAAVAAGGAGAALGLALLAAGQEALPPATPAGSVRGHVRVRVEGVRLADVRPLVVYLEGRDGPVAFDPPAETRTIRQHNATFSPSFLAVAAGQAVEMPNDDATAHNVFSYSKPNDFDLGVYPRGESRRVRFRYPGVVRLYCSIHASMNAVVFVSPTPYFAEADGSGGFAIRDVPPGTYRLRLWSEMLPVAERTVDVRAGAVREADIDVVEEAPR
jgi:plastocyanin